MANANYMAVSFALVWLLLVAYVGFLHLRVKKLREQWEQNPSSESEAN